jgi:type I restriction-modification system DNA methylase subunit
VPKEARWSHLQANAKQPTIGKLIDEAMGEIEKANPGLKGVLPKDYNRPALDKVMLGELIDLISGIAMGEPGDRAKDILGRVYEYFLGGFAGSEGKRGGEFYTPRSVVRVLVEMLEPYKGRVYDPCCGSGGMFVQSEKFVESHGGRIGDIAIYGQESNYTTWRLCKMNLAVRGIDADIRWNNEGSFHKDELKDLRFDYILANPPFNVSDWGGRTSRIRTFSTWQPPERMRSTSPSSLRPTHPLIENHPEWRAPIRTVAGERFPDRRSRTDLGSSNDGVARHDVLNGPTSRVAAGPHGHHSPRVPAAHARRRSLWMRAACSST